jgi:hypothetical protein
MKTKAQITLIVIVLAVAILACVGDPWNVTTSTGWDHATKVSGEQTAAAYEATAMFGGDALATQWPEVEK